MADYKTMKVPLKLWEIYAKYVETFDTIYDSATAMIQDVIKEKAKEILGEMNTKLQNTKSQLEELNDRLAALETGTKKSKEPKTK
jgi:hypothetical protein